MSTGTSISPSDPERTYLELPKDKAIRELERHGYVADPYSVEAPGAALCRHPIAPSLLVREDGRIELPTGQRVTQAIPPFELRRDGVYWGRTTLVVVLLCVAIFLGLLLIGLIVE